MNIYTQLKKAYSGKSVTLNIFFNEDETITTIIVADRHGAPVSITSANEERAIEMLEEALQREPKIEETTVDLIETEEEKPAKAEKKKAEVKKTEPVKVEKPVKLSKEEKAAKEKLDNIYAKIQQAIEKKDFKIAEFWYNDGATLPGFTDHDNHKECLRLVTELRDAEEKILETKEAAEASFVPAEIKEIVKESPNVILATINPVEIKQGKFIDGDTITTSTSLPKEQNVSSDDEDFEIPSV